MSDDIAGRARHAGLERLAPEHVAQLDRANALVERLAAELPRELALDVEPALTFRLRRDRDQDVLAQGVRAQDVRA